MTFDFSNLPIQIETPLSDLLNAAFDTHPMTDKTAEVSFRFDCEPKQPQRCYSLVVERIDEACLQVAALVHFETQEDSVKVIGIWQNHSVLNKAYLHNQALVVV